MNNIITVEREYGSGGGVIARKLAERLGWKLWDGLLTNEIARALSCDRGEVECREERRDPLYYRLLKSFMLGTFEWNPHAPELRLLDSDRIFAVTKQIISRVAKEGQSVIVGRGGAYFLQDRLDAHHVFVYASPEEKVRRLRAESKSEAEATELVTTVDAERAAFIKKYFNLEWPTRSLYHLMINSRIGEDAVVELILKGVDALEKTLVARS